MIRHDDSMYDLRRPPIMLIARMLPFTCAICHRRGMGPPNVKVHPGRCHEEHTRQKAKRNAERHKQEKLKEREAS